MTGIGQPWLRWALGLTLVATAWVAVTTDDVEPSVAFVPARPTRSFGPASENAGRVASAQTAAPALAFETPTKSEWAMTRQTPLSWPKLSANGLAAWGLPPPLLAPKVVALAPPPGPPPTPPPPTAPPFPYELVGRLQQGDQAQALMSGPVRTVALRAGDVVEGQWRIDKVDTSAVHLTWLPGAQPQRIEYGAAR